MEIDIKLQFNENWPLRDYCSFLEDMETHGFCVGGDELSLIHI